MKMSKMILAFSLVLAAGQVIAAADIIYKWKDSKGVVKYTQTKPPSGTPFKVIRDRSSSKAPITSDGSANLDSAAVKKKVATTNEERIARNCAISKANLEALSGDSKIRVEEDGESRELTNEEKSERFAKAKANVEKFCTES